MADLESRVAVLEAGISEIRATLTRIEGRLITTASSVEYLRGKVEALPTTWQMTTAIVAGQVALAGLIAAVVFGVAHLIGRV